MKFKQLKNKIVNFVRKHENTIKAPALVFAATLLGLNLSEILKNILFGTEVKSLDPTLSLLISCLMTSAIAIYVSGDIKYKKDVKNKETLAGSEKRRKRRRKRFKIVSPN